MSIQQDVYQYFDHIRKARRRAQEEIRHTLLRLEEETSLKLGGVSVEQEGYVDSGGSIKRQRITVKISLSLDEKLDANIEPK